MKKQQPILSVLSNVPRGTLQTAFKSVPSPCAQTTRLCGLPSEVVAVDYDYSTYYDLLRPYGAALLAVFTLQYLHGLRISEVLGIRHVDITTAGFVRVRGSKGSNSRVIACDSLIGYFQKHRLSGIEPFRSLDRFFVYRCYRRVGLSHKFAGNQHCSVTHLPRHLLALQANQVDADGTMVTDILRHKSLTNKKFYVKKS